MRSDNIKYSINNPVALLNGIRTCVIVLTTLLTSFTGFSQSNQKKELTAADYPLWSYLKAEKLSEKAKWVSFSLYYGNGNDTLFVKNSKGTKTYGFPGASKGEFSGDNWFVTTNAKGELKITNLLTSKQETVQEVLQYDLRADTKDLIILKKESNGKKQLELKNMATNQSIVLSDVGIYSYNPKADAVAYTTKSGNNTTIALLNLRNKATTLIASTTEACAYTDIVWQENAKSIAFLRQPSDDAKKTTRTSVGYYIIAEGTLSTFNPAGQDNFPIDMEIISSSFANLSIAGDGKRIFFGLQKTVIPVDTSQVQTWNAQDKFLYPTKVQIEGWDRVAKVAVWWPEQNRFSRITDNEFPNMMLSGDQKQAFVYNPQQYEPQANLYVPLDIYSMDLTTRERKLVLQNQLGAEAAISISIYEKHIVYFKDKHWWVYDGMSGLHKNLTKDLRVTFSDEESDWPEEAAPFGNPGWIEQDKTLFIYDKYDIWSIPLDGSTAFRLTNGRENKATHRIVVQSQYQSPHKSNYDGNYKGLFKPSDRLLIKTESLEHTGYCLWNRKTGLQPLLEKKMRTSQLLSSEKNDTYVYLEENFNVPPRILIKESRNSKEKVLFQSNPQHFKYNWGNSKLIAYANSKGNVLNGVLYYPANYQSDTKYPMVVYVYEKLSKELYNYVNPSQNNPTGFNIANFTSKGYFVFLPDIVYEIGNPGPSAADCVVSATKKIIASESIDSTRIGLIGHSYGGYETDYIITQTNMFAAAVAGAAITDYVSGYLYVSDMEKPNFFHYEFGQLRIGKSLYEDYAGYLHNSPIYHADKVNTPLLSWSGEQDYHVHYYQSIEFYLALRRLGKTNTMLLYPGESHVLSDHIHQQHLTRSIEQWFDHYLKGDKKTGVVLKI